MDRRNYVRYRRKIEVSVETVGSRNENGAFEDVAGRPVSGLQYVGDISTQDDEKVYVGTYICKIDGMNLVLICHTILVR